jgi:hypothetical protein
MGFIPSATVVKKFPPNHEQNEARRLKEDAKVEAQANRFYRALMDPRPVKPSVIKLMVFKKQQKAFGAAPVDLADFQFWKEKGWLEKTATYYYPVEIGKVKKACASLLSRVGV